MFNKQEADKLIAMITGCNQIINETKNKKDEYENQLLAMISPEVQNSLEGNAYGCGTANVETETKTIKVTVSKKVKWDQEKLKSLWDDIETSGNKPEEYINVKYDVSENAYKAWPSSISDAFEPARTVEVSKPTIKIEEKKK